MKRERDPETGQFLKGPPKPPAPPRTPKPKGWTPGRARKDGVWSRQVKRVTAALDEKGRADLVTVIRSMPVGTSEGDAVRYALSTVAAQIRFAPELRPGSWRWEQEIDHAEDGMGNALIVPRAGAQRYTYRSLDGLYHAFPIGSAEYAWIAELALNDVSMDIPAMFETLVRDGVPVKS
jgi:hypothetical protein